MNHDTIALLPMMTENGASRAFLSRKVLLLLAFLQLLEYAPHAEERKILMKRTTVSSTTSKTGVLCFFIFFVDAL